MQLNTRHTFCYNITKWWYTISPSLLPPQMETFFFSKCKFVCVLLIPAQQTPCCFFINVLLFFFFCSSLHVKAIIKFISRAYICFPYHSSAVTKLMTWRLNAALRVNSRPLFWIRLLMFQTNDLPTSFNTFLLPHAYPLQLRIIKQQKSHASTCVCASACS